MTLQVCLKGIWDPITTGTENKVHRKNEQENRGFLGVFWTADTILFPSFHSVLFQITIKPQKGYRTTEDKMEIMLSQNSKGEFMKFQVKNDTRNDIKSQQQQEEDHEILIQLFTNDIETTSVQMLNL